MASPAAPSPFTTAKAVFLSYASHDAAAARKICDGLRAAGIEVWFDQSELRGGDRGMALMACRRHADAVPVLEKAEALSAPPIIWALGAIALAKLGRNDEAIRKARAALDPIAKGKWPRGFTAFSDGLAAWGLAEAGARAEAEAIVRQLRLEPEEWRFSAGFALAALGQREEAFALLAGISQWVVDYLLLLADQNDDVRNDTRFGELLRKLDALDAFETLRQTLGEPVPTRCAVRPDPPFAARRRVGPGCWRGTDELTRRLTQTPPQIPSPRAAARSMTSPRGPARWRRHARG